MKVSPERCASGASPRFVEVSPWDGVYCTILGQVNRLHRLEVLMEKWTNGAAIEKRDKEIEVCHNLNVKNLVNEYFDMYWDAGVDSEETIQAIASSMQMYGVQFFFRNRFTWLTEDDQDEDMYYSAVHLAAKAYVLDVCPHSLDVNHLP